MTRKIETRGGGPPKDDQLLTDRELQVMKEVATGKTNTLIGSTLEISVNTVNTHIAKALSRLGVPDRTAAVMLLVQSGDIESKDIQVIQNPQGRQRFDQAIKMRGSKI